MADKLPTREELLNKNKSDKPDNTTYEPDDVEKARQAAEIQQHETERIKSLQEAELTKHNIDSINELIEREKKVAEDALSLAKQKSEFESNSASVESNNKMREAEIDEREQELDMREQELSNRETNVSSREKLCSEREEKLNAVEKQKLKDEQIYNSITKQLERNFNTIVNILGRTANILHDNGYRKLCNSLWDEIEKLKELSQDKEKNCNTIISWLKGMIEDCNSHAVEMSRNPKQFMPESWNSIVDNLEKIYNLMPILKPDYLPDNKKRLGAA